MAGWIEFVDPHHPAAKPVALVLQLTPDLAEGRIRKRQGQAMIPEHSSHIQVFHAQNCVGARDLGRQLVQNVCPTIGNPCMKSSQLIFSLPPTLTTLLAAGQAAAQAFQVGEFRAQQHLVFVLRAIAQHDQLLETQVHARRVPEEDE